MLWFQDNPPKSGIGKIKLAEMLIKNNFQNEGYWLLNKFGYDKRKAHLSSLILTDQLSRDDALSELKNKPYSNEEKIEDF